MTPPVAKTTKETERASRRYLQLVEELIREYADKNPGATARVKERGAISAVAEQLDVSQGHVSRLLARERGARDGLIRTAMARLRIREEYFYGLKEPATYHDYVGHGKEPIFPAWKEFLEKRNGELKKDERDAVAAAPVPEGYEPTVAFYESHLFAHRHLLTRIEVARTAEKTEEIRGEARLRKKTPQNPPEGG